MPLFTITFEREVSTYERVTRTVEAADINEAEAMGDQIASGFDSWCPDDLTTETTECQSWRNHGVRDAAPGETPIDEEF